MTYLTTREVADRCRVSPDTVLSWRTRGLLAPAGRTPKGFLWEPESVRAFLMRKAATPIAKHQINEILNRRLG